MGTKRVNSHGMTLLELLITVGVITILIAAGGVKIKGLVQRAKVSAAKVTIHGFALCLGMTKDDTGLYPLNLSDTKEGIPPQGFSQRDWYGPYGETLSLTDPWGNPYFYELQNTVFGPQAFERTTGGPYEETFIFPASPGEGMLVVSNPGVTSGSIILNGEEIVSENEFQKITPTIIKVVDLLASNSITISLAGAPGTSIRVSISASSLSKDATYVLGSYGKDGQVGGAKYDADIVYGDF